MNTTIQAPGLQRLRRTLLRLPAAAVVTVMLAGCDPLSLTMIGIGSGAGISHHMGGIAYRTFTEPMPKVQNATLAALRRMAIQVSGTTKTETGAVIKAKANNRDIEIEIESLTPTTTRMRAVARKDGGLFVDAATAIEIISQTERVLGA